MVIIPDQEEPEEDDEPEPLIDVSEASPVSMASQPQVRVLDQHLQSSCTNMYASLKYTVCNLSLPVKQSINV